MGVGNEYEGPGCDEILDVQAIKRRKKQFMG